MKANIFHAELIVNELYMVANILSVQLEGMIVADSELPGKLVGTVFAFLFTVIFICTSQELSLSA